MRMQRNGMPLAAISSRSVRSGGLMSMAQINGRAIPPHDEAGQLRHQRRWES